MKRVFLSVFALVATIATAQDFTVTNGDQGVITNGEVFTFSGLGEDNEVKIQVNNLSEEDMFFRLKAESRENTDGTNVNFCFGEVCLFSFNPGTFVPPSPVYDNYLIPAGGSNHFLDKFFNNNPGEGDFPMVFEFGLYKYDSVDQEVDSGEKVLGFTYKYDPTASLSDMTLQSLGVNVINTLVSGDFSFHTSKSVTLELFDLNGKKVASQNYKEGNSNYNASSLNTGVYIARFIDGAGNVASIKIAKK